MGIFLLFFGGVSLTHPMLASFLSGGFSYTSYAGVIFIWGVSLTHPMLAFFFFNLGSFSYPSHVGFTFILI